MYRFFSSSLLISIFLFVGSVAKAAVTEGNGDRQWISYHIDSDQIKQLTVSGPVYVELKWKPDFQPCNQARIKIDKNLNKYLEFKQVDDQLIISLDKGFIPTDWVEARLFCMPAMQVKAENYAVVIMRTPGVDELKLYADNALISVVGAAKKLNAIAKNGGILGLTELAVEAGNLMVSGGSYTKLLRSDQIEIDSSSGAGVYVLDKTQPVGKREEISPGVQRVFLNLYIHDYASAYNAKKDFQRILPLLKESTQP